jgi:hypothetical protein
LRPPAQKKQSTRKKYISDQTRFWLYLYFEINMAQTSSQIINPINYFFCVWYRQATPFISILIESLRIKIPFFFGQFFISFSRSTLLIHSPVIKVKKKAISGQCHTDIFRTKKKLRSNIFISCYWPVGPFMAPHITIDRFRNLPIDAVIRERLHGDNETDSWLFVMGRLCWGFNLIWNISSSPSVPSDSRRKLFSFCYVWLGLALSSRWALKFRLQGYLGYAQIEMRITWK